MFIRTLRRTSRDFNLLRRTAGLPAPQRSTKRTEADIVSDEASTLPGIVRTPFRAEPIGQIPEYPNASPHYRRILQKYIARDYRITGSDDDYIYLNRVRQVDEHFYIIDLARIHPKSGAVPRRYRSRYYWAELPESLMNNLYPAILKAYQVEEDEMQARVTSKFRRVVLIVIALFIALSIFASYYK